MAKRISVGSNSILFKQSISIVLDLSGVSGGDYWRYKASGLGGFSIGETPYIRSMIGFQEDD